MSPCCFYCGKTLTRKTKTRDHLVPRSKQGGNGQNNIVPACRKCNGEKGCLNLEEFRLVVAFRKGLIRKARFTFPGEAANFS